MANRVAAYRGEGYPRFQLNVGGEHDVVIERHGALAAISNLVNA